MTKKIVLVVLMVGLFGFFRGCFAGMPYQMPADFTLEFSTGAGMIDQSSEMDLSLKNCSINERYGGFENKITFSLSKVELNAVYHILRQNSFPRIRTNGSMINDKGGESVSVSWGATHYHLGTSGTDVGFLWRHKWDNIVSFLSDFQEKEETKQKITFPIKLDASLVEKKVTLQVGSDVLFYGKVDKAQRFSVRILPGHHQLNVQIPSDSPSSLGPASSQNLTIDTESVRGLKIRWTANQLVVEEDYYPLMVEEAK